jgi:Family of unknown function (DUF6156)/RHS Repeat
MKLAILLLALGGLILGALVVRYVLAPRQPHDPFEYYASWGGYRHPIMLKHRISQQEADALNAKGAVYLIATFDGDSRLLHVTKFYRGEMFFEYVYAYHPNGRLKSATVTREGRVTVLEYDARGRRVSEARMAF